MADLVNLGEMLDGVQVMQDDRIAEGGIVMQVVMLASVMDAEGEQCWHLIASEGCEEIQVIGALSAMLHHRQVRFERGFEEMGDD